MTFAKHLLLLLTVAALAANPALACCLGDGARTAESTQLPQKQLPQKQALQMHRQTAPVALPCHGSAGAIPDASAPSTPAPAETGPSATNLSATASADPTLCSGCLDCDSSALVPTVTAKLDQGPSAVELGLLPASEQHWAPRRRPMLIRVHGPPPTPPKQSTTQVSLQQLLLI